MSSKQRGTKRAADSNAVGHKQKAFKGTPGGKPSGGKPPSGGKSFKGKGKAPAFKGKAPAYKDKPKPAPKATTGAARETAAPAQRRKRPVTQGGGDEDVDEDDEMSVDGSDEYDNDEFDVEGGDENGEGGAGEGEKKPKMTKAERAAHHAANPHRTTLLPSHALLTETLLPLWEHARRLEMPKDERKQAIDDLWAATKGHVLEISRGHKGGRILQTIVKYGNKEQRTDLAMELQPKWREMMESKYSKFLMGKLIRYCPSIRPLLVPAIAKDINSLLFHADAIQPISDFYDLWGSAKERRGLVRGFYPREVALFDGGKDGGDTTGLEGALEATSEAGRLRVLEGVEKTVLDVFNATQKTALAQSIFHRLVWEYLTCIYRFLDAETADQKMHELLAASLESLPEIVHTKDGSAVVRELLVRGSAKDRKSILQHLRKHIEAIAKDADAQLVLFTAFDVVDDTKLMGKAFVSDLVGLAGDLAQDKNGRRAVLYLLTPTASRHYMPSTLGTLAASAHAAREAGMSKKDPAVRRSEIVGYASPGLLGLVAERADELVRDPGSGLLVQEILLNTEGDKAAAIDALVAPLRVPLIGDGSHPLELAHATRTYKTLLSGGHFNTATKTIEVADAKLSPAFAEAFWRALASDEAGGPSNAIKAAAAAPFVAVEMLSALKDTDAFNEAREVLTGQDARDAITTGGMKGANVLIERLDTL